MTALSFIHLFIRPLSFPDFLLMPWRAAAYVHRETPGSGRMSITGKYRLHSDYRQKQPKSKFAGHMQVFLCVCLF